MLWWPALCFGAGGQFAVDDAAVLDKGRCQVEIWGDSEHRAPTRVTHLGPSCRAGPVELGLNIDRLPNADADSTTLAGVQAKWATALTDRLSVGAVAAAARDATHGRDTVTTVYAPVTFKASNAVALNVNLGWDFFQHLSTQQHSGVSIDWAPVKPLTFTAERFRQNGNDAARVGVHWDACSWFAVETSRNWSLETGGPRGWTLGIVVGFPAP